MNFLARSSPFRAAALLLAAGLCAGPARADDHSGGSDWPMFGHDPLGTRNNAGETRLRASNVAGLEVKWTFATPAVVPGTPAVVGDAVFDGDAAGNFYALDAKS